MEHKVVASKRNGEIWEIRCSCGWLIISDRYICEEAHRDHAAPAPQLGDEPCRCNGYGWLLDDYDRYHQCPEHYRGQTHPEVRGYEIECEMEAERCKALGIAIA